MILPRSVLPGECTRTNPVAAGLVERGRMWPGVHSCALDPGQPLRVERPVGTYAFRLDAGVCCAAPS